MDDRGVPYNDDAQAKRASDPVAEARFVDRFARNLTVGWIMKFVSDTKYRTVRGVVKGARHAVGGVRRPGIVIPAGGGVTGVKMYSPWRDTAAVQRAYFNEYERVFKDLATKAGDGGPR
jgi:hypothetical protein